MTAFGAPAESEKFPSESVVVPVVVPFIITETPGNGELSIELVTLPLTVACCADARNDHSNNEKRNARGLNALSKQCFVHFLIVGNF